MLVLNRLLYVQMKTGRANVHLEALEREVRSWIERPPHTVKEWSDLEGWYFWAINTLPVPEQIPLLVGDFVCCLRAALDQLAWALRRRDITKREERQVGFLIFNEDDSTHKKRRLLFPTAVADTFDTIQPYRRGDAYKSDPLWKLDELWRLDKHRIIPTNCNQVSVNLPIPYRLLGPDADSDMIVRASRRDVLRMSQNTGPVHLQPNITVEILLGEYMGEFEVPIGELRQIYDVVTNEVMPKFQRFLE
jgi:hypothetical protein